MDPLLCQSVSPSSNGKWKRSSSLMMFRPYYDTHISKVRADGQYVRTCKHSFLFLQENGTQYLFMLSRLLLRTLVDFLRIEETIRENFFVSFPFFTFCLVVRNQSIAFTTSSSSFHSFASSYLFLFRRIDCPRESRY